VPTFTSTVTLVALIPCTAYPNVFTSMPQIKQFNPKNKFPVFFDFFL
jgi:hypothetical protein